MKSELIHKMNEQQFLLEKIATLVKVEFFSMKKDSIVSFQNHVENNPIYKNEILQSKLIDGANKQEEPYIYMDLNGVSFACVKQKDAYFFIGPIALKQLNKVELHQYYKSYELSKTTEKQLKHFTMSQMLDLVELVTKIIIGKEYTHDHLIDKNQLAKNQKEQIQEEQVLFHIKEGTEELYHHTYLEERELLDNVRMGRAKEALRCMRNMDGELGQLSAKELNHWKNVAIVAIALCTRVAIESGVSPAVAYGVSDFYIQKSDQCSDMTQVIKYRDQAVEEITHRVHERITKRTSNYVELCKDYVAKNYREKLYLSQIAEALDLSPSYLSKLFRKETGKQLQKYIIEVRIDRAANLLKYSEETIAGIAKYVNFPSQSYFGKIFKQHKNMTPKQYRETYKIKEVQ